MAAAFSFGCIRAAFVDLSGTLHIGNSATPHAIEALSKLRKTGLKIRFVTNTTKEDVTALQQRLAQIGFSIEKEEIYSSLIAARDYINKLGCRPYLMLSDEAKKDFKGLNTDDPNAVLVGLSPEHFKYDSMNKAFTLLLQGFPLIAVHKARYFKGPEGLLLGPGAFVQGLEYATETVATVVGKPEKNFFLRAAASMECSPEECLMIGDDARDDVMGAVNAGMKGILVKTGKYRAGDEFKIDVNSACAAENFANAVDMVVKQTSY